ncbi:MAG TPA: ABC transporter ATP-binding protein [Alphaproteobacteria bacterium]|nr:ABC transporter ATP-binding protein [Alphaproteobacteria bacterium]
MANGNNLQCDGGTDVPLVRLRGLAKNFGRVEAVKPLDLEIGAGDFLAILGPSGCGKTTLLRMIGGFVGPTSGTVEIDGRDVTRLGPERRPTNMVFQGYGLFPHMTVHQNIAYGLKIARTSRDEIDRRVEEVIALVRLEELARRGIDELSGGQQQRVALARALVMRPKVLLLDEPLGALDLKLRQAMQEELRRIHHQIGGTFVFVTHDQSEALGLANRIAVMEEGSIVQEGGPEDIYARPRTRFVSTFIGEANILSGRRRAGAVQLDSGISLPDDPGPDCPVIAIVRPEAVRIAAEGSGFDVRAEGVIIDMVYLGSYVKFRIRLDDGEVLIAHVAALDLDGHHEVGARVVAGWSNGDHRILEDE